jgi:hypothetical protein
MVTDWDKGVSDIEKDAAMSKKGITRLVVAKTFFQKDVAIKKGAIS